jgi:hypothetical protein
MQAPLYCVTFPEARVISRSQEAKKCPTPVGHHRRRLTKCYGHWRTSPQLGPTSSAQHCSPHWRSRQPLGQPVSYYSGRPTGFDARAKSLLTWTVHDGPMITYMLAMFTRDSYFHIFVSPPPRTCLNANALKSPMIRLAMLGLWDIASTPHCTNSTSMRAVATYRS